MALLKTPLWEIHKEAGARMVDFAGWSMPVQYTSIIEEHKNTREKAGLFDISHMGEILISGSDSFSFLQYILTNDMQNLTEGKCFYSAICYENGGTVDDCFIYMFSDTRFWIIVNASNIEKDLKWLKQQGASFEVKIEDQSSRTAKIDVQGPMAHAILKKSFKDEYKDLKRFHFEFFSLNDMKMVISRTGYTGEDGFEIYLDREDAPELWNLLLEDGSEFGLKPAGLGARDTLRLEACYSLYGHELSEEITPVEAGIGWVVRDYKYLFVGKEVLEAQKKEGTARELIAFELEEKAIPRQGYLLLKDQKEAGVVTSGSFAPTLQKSIGLGFINKEYNEEGAAIQVQIRNKLYNAKIVKKPFYQYQGGK